VRKAFLLNKGNSKPSGEAGGNCIDRKQFRDAVERMGMNMSGEEFRKLWRRFDSSGDGSISYAEFNNQLGAMISPPCMGLQMNRPETPKMKDWQKKVCGRWRTARTNARARRKRRKRARPSQARAPVASARARRKRARPLPRARPSPRVRPPASPRAHAAPRAAHRQTHRSPALRNAI